MAGEQRNDKVNAPLMINCNGINNSWKNIVGYFQHKNVH